MDKNKINDLNSLLTEAEVDAKLNSLLKSLEEELEAEGTEDREPEEADAAKVDVEPVGTEDEKKAEDISAEVNEAAVSEEVLEPNASTVDAVAQGVAGDGIASPVVGSNIENEDETKIDTETEVKPDGAIEVEVKPEDEEAVDTTEVEKPAIDIDPLKVVEEELSSIFAILKGQTLTESEGEEAVKDGEQDIEDAAKKDVDVVEFKNEKDTADDENDSEGQAHEIKVDSDATEDKKEPESDGEKVADELADELEAGMVKEELEAEGTEDREPKEATAAQMEVEPVGTDEGEEAEDISIEELWHIVRDCSDEEFNELCESILSVEQIDAILQYDNILTEDLVRAGENARDVIAATRERDRQLNQSYKDEVAKLRKSGTTDSIEKIKLLQQHRKEQLAKNKLERYKQRRTYGQRSLIRKIGTAIAKKSGKQYDLYNDKGENISKNPATDKDGNKIVKNSEPKVNPDVAKEYKNALNKEDQEIVDTAGTNTDNNESLNYTEENNILQEKSPVDFVGLHVDKKTKNVNTVMGSNDKNKDLVVTKRTQNNVGAKERALAVADPVASTNNNGKIRTLKEAFEAGSAYYSTPERVQELQEMIAVSLAKENNDILFQEMSKCTQLAESFKNRLLHKYSIISENRTAEFLQSILESEACMDAVKDEMPEEVDADKLNVSPAGSEDEKKAEDIDVESLEESLTDFELLKVLDESGYEPSLENLSILKEYLLNEGSKSSKNFGRAALIAAGLGATSLGGAGVDVAHNIKDLSDINHNITQQQEAGKKMTLQDIKDNKEIKGIAGGIINNKGIEQYLDDKK